MRGKINDGGPAFPFQANDQDNFYMQDSGMSLRAYFAGQALIGMGMWTPEPPKDESALSDGQRHRVCALKAQWAVAQADALIAELGIKP